MSLDKTLLGIAKSAVDTQRKSRDGRNVVSKGVDAVTNKSYANEDKKVAAAALRKWENETWKPKVEVKLKQELQRIAPKLKPGSPKYQETYDSLYNKNHQGLQAAKAKAYQQLGTLRQKGQTQRQVDNRYTQKEASRNNNTRLQAASSAARDTGEAVSGALATGTSRALRYPLQLAADVGENDDGGIFDRGAKALERHEDNLQQVYPAYADIQQNGNFGQKLALSAVEQIPNLALSFTGAGAAAKGAQLAGAGAKMTAATAYGTAAATLYPQAYGDGNDSTKQEIEEAQALPLSSKKRSKKLFEGHFNDNIKAGLSEDESWDKARDQTISSIAEETGHTVGVATALLSLIAPGIGSFTANQAAGGAVSKFGQKVFNKLAVRADAGKVAKYAVPAAVGAGIVGLNVAEEALQEGYTDYTAQQAAVDVGVKNKINLEQTKEAALMGGILGGFMGGGVYVGTRNSKFQKAQDGLREAQDTYAQAASIIPQLQQQIEEVSPRSAEGQALTAQLEETKAALSTMAAEAETRGIPKTSLVRRAPRIDPTNSFDTDFNGQVDGATELSEQDFENALNPDGTPAPQVTPAEPVMSEQELDIQDAQLAEFIAEQHALDEAIEDGSNDKPVEQSLAEAQNWYDSKRGEGKQGLSGVVSRAAATEQDAAFAQQQEGIKGATASINDYIASERAKQQQIDAQLQQEAQAATTDAEKQAVAQKIEQRDAERAKEDDILDAREQLAQPYENELFDTTIIGADGAPFKLARFWDSSLPAGAKAKAIAEAFGGQVDQNVAKSDWANLPEGVQKELHRWFTERLDGVRQSREGASVQTSEQVAAPAVEQPQEVAPTGNGLTMPTQQAPSATTKRRTPSAGTVAQQEESLKKINEELKNYTPAASQLTDENPVINIPAPGGKAVNIATKPTVSSKVSQALIDKYGATKTYGREPWQLIGENDYGMPIYQHQNGERITQKASGDNLGAEAVTPDSYTVDAKELAKEHYTKEEVEAARERGQARADESKKSVAPTTEEGVYKSKPAAKAAIKKQNLDPKIVADTLQAQREIFKATIDGKSFDKRADAIEAANKFIEDNVRLGTDKPIEVGTYAGVQLRSVWDQFDSEPKVIMDLGGQRFAGKGIAGLEAVMRNFPKFIESSQADIDKANTTVKNLEKALDQPFGQAQDLERNIKQLADLQKDLEMNPVPPPAWLRQGAPMDSEVYRNKSPFIVTGHRYDSNGWFVIAEDDKGQVAIPYLEAKDASGMALYDEKDFVAPEVTENKRGKDSKKPDGKNDNELEIDIEADRVPAKDDSNRPTLDDMPKYSKTNPAKGNTGTTAKQVVNTLQKHFGKEAVASLVKSGKLRVRSLNDFVNADGRLLIPSDAEGFYYDGKVVLIADNLTADNAVATLLHEMGGHAGIQSMLDPQTYMGLMANFDALVKSGNKYAVRAKERAEASTDSDSEARDEYIPYLITEYAQASERGGAIGVIKRFVNRVMAGVRAWMRNHTGVQLKMTPNDMVQLAERMVKRLSEQSATDMTIADVENMPAAEMQFSGSNIPSQQVAAIRKQYKGSASWMKAPNGEPTKLSEKQWLQVRTPHFKDWFGDWEDNAANASKVVDTNGEPLVMYHGTNQDFWAFDMDRSIKGRNNGMRGMFFSDNAELAASYSVDTMNNPDIVEARRSGDRAYVDSVKARLLTEATTNADANTKAVFINSRTPLEQDMKGGSFWEANQNAAARMEINQDKWDGVINDNVEDNASNESAHGPTKVVISFDPTNIKSATDNVGMFNASNADIRYSNKPQFSRRYSNLGTDGKPVTAKEKALDKIALAQATTMSSKFGINLLLRRHLATPQHVALLNPVFKLFTDNIQSRIAYENNEAGLVQTLLPEIWDTRLVVGKKKAAMERVSTAIFDGTMADQVWTDSELETKFNHTRQDIGFYRRARRAIDKSVMNMTVDTLSSLAKGTKLVNMETIQRLKLAGMHPIFHNLALQQHMTDELQKLAKGGLITPKAEARMQKQLDAVFDVMGAVAGKYDKLVEDGYAPLMRFGHYAVEVRDKISNDLDLFELYETKGQQRKAIKDLKERYDESQFTVGTGTLNPEGFKQFKNKGLSPETVQLFAAELGLDDDSGYQAYLKIAVSDRSALKRLIHRKKVPGYSEDMPRVLSSFVMSNARYSGRGLYNSEIERSIQNIEDGNLQNEAQKVFENIENPQEEFAQQRSLMFHYFMGFSPAFFFLNLTQPFTQTIPKLTAYAGAAKGHAYMAQALGIVGKNMGASAIEMGKKVAGMPTPNWRGFEDKLPAWVKKEDYLRMAREGHLDPQNIYMIKGLERGKGGVASGIWGNIESAAGWFAEVSESMNRRSTMIAAFRVAHDMGDAKLKAKGFDSKYDFAVSIIQQTQGIYNKGNRSGLARGNGKLGQYGPLILVFKQFTINYTEQMIRHGKDKEVKSLAVAMMWQFALAGMLGLPFADDLRDLFEGIAYRVFGKAFNLPDYLEGLLGKSNADALMYGLASEKGRIDLFGRSSLGNVIPGTDVIRPGPTDWAEILGASSGFYESFFSAASMAADGKYKDALITASPRYIRDAASGAEIALTGSYRNTKGDKIMDLDKTDAVIKSLAFNPANNARPGRDRSNAYEMKNMLKAKTDYFSKHLAEAIYQENDERLDELYNEMDAWNERNAEHFNVDIDKIEKSAEKRVERKDFGSAERQSVQDSLAQRQDDLAGT